MLCSMTAFARQSAEGEWGTAVWEIRTVNHRYLEPGIRLPEDLRGLEPEVRDRLSQRLSRGKVDCTLKLGGGARQAEFTINSELVTHLKDAAHHVEPNSSLNPMDLLKWPGVLEMPTLDPDTTGAAILEVLDATLDQLVDARVREGNKLGEAMYSRIELIRVQVEYLVTRVPDIIAAQRTRHVQRVQDLAPDIDEGRLEQECALLAQKLDVAEELDRLQAHVGEVERVLKKGGAVGRRLDFLMQEMHREANTIGSKSAHIDTTNASVELKVLIEQMREQVQNIE
ncbi:MAG: YicC family protein [Gammaproteobacteria bacterium]|nr:YicC family protein [Gammaproteobacteria bacterium]